MLLAAGCAGDGAAKQFATVERDAATGAWWFRRGSERFLSVGVSNLNDGGLDDGGRPPPRANDGGRAFDPDKRLEAGKRGWRASQHLWSTKDLPFCTKRMVSCW